MADENEVIDLNSLNAMTVTADSPLTKYSEEDFADVSKVGDYLPRLQVMGSNSDPVKEGKIPQGVLALVKDKNNPVDVGKELEVVVVSWRPKAMRLDGGTPLSYFNRHSAEFKAVAAESDIKDSNCMFGPEFLLYVPTRKTFATFYMGSKSARKESPNMLALMKKAAEDAGRPGFAMAPATIRVKFIAKSATNKYSWHAPQVNPCTTPQDVSAVDPEEFKEELTKFNNPPESKVEKVGETAGTASGEEVRAR